MNRAPQPVGEPRPQASGPQFSIQTGLFAPPAGDTSCWVFAPLHYEPRYGYPLLVWLHGPCDDERQLMRVMPMMSLRNYVAVAPRGNWCDAGDGRPAGYRWRQTDADILHAEQRVFDCIELVEQKYHVAGNRVFLAGYESGGTMALRLAMNHPRRFAGVVSIGGRFPRGRQPFGNLPDVRRVPMLFVVGRNSVAYPSPQLCEDIRLFHSAGMWADLREYPGGDDLSPQMLADVDRWIIDRVTAARAAAAG